MSPIFWPVSIVSSDPSVPCERLLCIANASFTQTTGRLLSLPFAFLERVNGRTNGETTGVSKLLAPTAR